MTFASRASGAMAQTGGTVSLALEGMRGSFGVRHWWREYFVQANFLVSVTLTPVVLIAIPLGATISLQIGQLTRQLGGESFTGAAVIVGVIREAAPIAAALLIAGAGGSAMAADMGARNIRDELAAMEVMAVNPVSRLVTPRLWAASSVGMLLVAMVIVGGIGGGFFFNVVIQGVSPGAFFNGATALVRMSDLVVALGKAGIFGFVAAAIACQLGMNCDRSPIGVGMGVKQAVVATFLVVFTINYVITSMYVILVPQRIF
ncbi:MAG: ABC transporter permease [Acidimicrobiales bacterium]|nr:ABC transporter permease [Acidimicrobiales bacterium]